MNLIDGCDLRDSFLKLQMEIDEVSSSLRDKCFKLSNALEAAQPFLKSVNKSADKQIAILLTEIECMMRVLPSIESCIGGSRPPNEKIVAEIIDLLK